MGDIIKHLQELEDDNKLYASRSIDGEERALKDAVLSRLAAAVYAGALDTLLSDVRGNHGRGRGSAVG